MNYAVVAIGGLLFMTTCMWFSWGRSQFAGPVKTMIKLSDSRKAVADRESEERDKHTVDAKCD